MPEGGMKCLVVIVGPTATGKSQLARHLAQNFNGEIISAESRQVYHDMAIGTAKPSREELALVPHYLIDIINPDEDFSLAQFQQLAYRAIQDVQQRHKLPLLVGGSGLYVWTVLEGWEIPPVPPHPEFRRSLEEKVAVGGSDELYQQLLQIDPLTAQSVDRRNVRRLIRALEIHRYTEPPFSQLQHKQSPSFDTLIIGLTTDRADLYHRIDARVDRMIEQGLVEEVRKLLHTGYSFNLPAMSGIGYKQIGQYLRGELTLAEAVQQIKFETHRFVRRQYNWFRLKDSRIRWFDIRNSRVETEIAEEVKKFIARS